MTEPTTITCPACDGLAFVVVACRCVDGGDQFLVDWDAAAGEPWRDCQLCRGVGSVAQGCVACRQRGRRRAHLVLTMANLDTGAVASRQVVPGTLVPTRGSDGVGWYLPLDPLVRELVTAVGAGTVSDVRYPGRPLGELSLSLPARWRPDLPVEHRLALEAEVIAGQDHDPWWVFLGRTAVLSCPDPEADLSRLCVVADLLRLDLVVEARRQPWDGLSWDVRYEVPGAEVPDNPCHRGDDLPAAVAATTVAEALSGLAERGRLAPAYTIEPGPPDRIGPPAVDLDQVERRVHADLAEAAGAQAIWRDGRWWHTRLRVGGRVEILTERDTGQIARRTTTALHRTWQPPSPSWLGQPIPYDRCPDCDPANRLRRCYCTLGGRPADPDCPACSGAGMAASPLPCHTCRGSHRQHRAVAVTITDLRHRVIHQTWRPTPGTTAPLVASQPGGKPVHQLPDRYRLARWATTFGVRPENLTEADTGHEIGQDLRDGTITLPWAGADPLAEHIRSAGRGLPAARLLVVAAAPDAPPLTDMIRLALGLHLGIIVTVEDHRHDNDDPLRIHGRRWQVEIVPFGDPTTRLSPPLHPSPEAAVASCLTYLENALADTVPDDPDKPINAPRNSAPSTAVADPTPLIEALAHHHAGQPVSAYLDRAGCRLFLHERDAPRQIAQARTLTVALTALGM